MTKDIEEIQAIIRQVSRSKIDELNIEAMKLFNEIESEISGKVMKILVKDGDAVEYDMPLMLIEPN